MQEKTGLEVQVVFPSSYESSVERLCAGQADMAWLATPAYLLAAERCGARSFLRVLRNDSPSYRTQWIAQSDAARVARGLEPIRSLQDLEGKVVAFTDLASPTGYLFPRAMLAEAGVRPMEEVLVGGDMQAVLAVYRGEVDAAATFWAPPGADGRIGDARGLLLASYADVVGQVKILRLSEPIPNDPIVWRNDLEPDVRAILGAGWIEVARSPEGLALLRELYGLSGVMPVGDAEYDVVREMARVMGLSAQDLLARLEATHK
ncbi:MAG: phosphate/phosphite/phosphonate ABC transporter substrate-binding protein [Chloroflexi bacterium]|nr:phosphate/phosphite/phosphonate ABC transporter substrate-binding protein [Chloroflexota bacterium]